MKNIRMGGCTHSPSEVLLFKKYGYDFIESHFRLVNEMSEREFEELLAVTRETGVLAEGMNCFADPPMRLLECSFSELDDYLERGLIRPKRMGTEYIVIGSGGARRIPEGMNYEAATEKFVTMLSRYGKIADQYDVDIVLEPLFKKGCNFINTFREGVEICKQVNHPRVGCLMDFFHSHQENEPFSVLGEAGSFLKHIHFSTLDRRIPVNGDEEETRMLIDALKAIRYRGRVTMEGDAFHDLEQELCEFSKQFPLFE